MLVLTLIVERVCWIACIIYHVIEVSDRISQPSVLLNLARGDVLWLAFFMVDKVYRTLLHQTIVFKYLIWRCETFGFLKKVEMGQ